VLNPLLEGYVRRRDLIKVIVGSMTACPLAARAQQPGKLPTIGFLGTVTQSEWPVEAFDKRLRELGWIEGRTITIEYRWAEGRDERITEFVAEFVRSKVESLRLAEMRSLLQSRRHRLFLSFSLRLNGKAYQLSLACAERCSL